MGGGLVPGTCPRNEYGEARFVCRAQLPRAGSAMWDPVQARMVQYDAGRAAFFCDRRRSVQVRVRLEDIPFHEAGFKQFATLMARRGAQSELLYLWAKRVGDCLEIE